MGTAVLGIRHPLPWMGSSSKDLQYKGIYLLWHPNPLYPEGLKGAGGCK